MKSLELNKVKVVVFDFDETLYSGGDWSKYFDYCAEAFIQNGMFKTHEEVFKTLEEFFPGLEIFGHRVACYLQTIGKSNKFYRDYLSQNIYNMLTDDIEILDDELLFRLSKKYKLFMVSDSPKTHIDFYMDRFGISQKPFSEIYINDFNIGDFTKSVYISKIIEDLHLKPEEVLMIGDSEFSDMKAAERVGAQHFKVNNLDDTKNIIKILINS